MKERSTKSTKAMKLLTLLTGIPTFGGALGIWWQLSADATTGAGPGLAFTVAGATTGIIAFGAGSILFSVIAAWLFHKKGVTEAQRIEQEKQKALKKQQQINRKFYQLIQNLFDICNDDADKVCHLLRKFEENELAYFIKTFCSVHTLSSIHPDTTEFNQWLQEIKFKRKKQMKVKELYQKICSLYLFYLNHKHSCSDIQNHVARHFRQKGRPLLATALTQMSDLQFKKIFDPIYKNSNSCPAFKVWLDSYELIIKPVSTYATAITAPSYLVISEKTDALASEKQPTFLTPTTILDTAAMFVNTWGGATGTLWCVGSSIITLFGIASAGVGVGIAIAITGFVLGTIATITYAYLQKKNDCYQTETLAIKKSNSRGKNLNHALKNIIKKSKKKKQSTEEKFFEHKKENTMQQIEKDKSNMLLKKALPDSFNNLFRIHETATEFAKRHGNLNELQNLLEPTYGILGKRNTPPHNHLQAALSFHTNYETLSKRFSTEQIDEMKNIGLELISSVGYKYSLTYDENTETATATTLQSQMPKLPGDDEKIYRERLMAHMISKTMQLAPFGTNFYFKGNAYSILAGAKFLYKLTEEAKTIKHLNLQIHITTQEGSFEKTLFNHPKENAIVDTFLTQIDFKQIIESHWFDDISTKWMKQPSTSKFNSKSETNSAENSEDEKEHLFESESFA